MYMIARGKIAGREFTVSYHHGKFHYPKGEDYDMIIQSRLFSYKSQCFYYTPYPDDPLNAHIFMYSGLFDELLYFRRDGTESLLPYRKNVIY